MTDLRVDRDEETKVRRMDLSYMHRPPRIVPNYGKKTTSILPKSSVSRVLLYDNVTQQQMLDVKLSSLSTEKHKACRLLDLHRKSFLLRRMMKLQHAQEHKTVTATQPEVFDYLLPILISENSPDRGGRVPVITQGDSSVRLPHIGEARSAQVGGLQEERRGGVTRMLHTLQCSSDTSGSAPHISSRRRTVLDKRFQGLEKLLVTLDDPGNGYIELSPSYPRDTARVTDSLLRLGLVLTGNSSDHS